MKTFKILIPFVLLLLLIIGAAGFDIYKAYGTQETVTITVTEKTVKRVNEEDRYLIYTDNEVFEMTDSLLLGQFDTADDYGKIKEGSTYTVRVVGWRVPFFSWYRNIYKIEE